MRAHPTKRQGLRMTLKLILTRICTRTIEPRIMQLKDMHVGVIAVSYKFITCMTG